MSKDYAFRDLVTHSGASKNEVTNWVQKGLIRPDVRDTSGTGSHRRFGFLDVFEACVVGKLNQLPGGMPIAAMGMGLEAIRFETVLATLSPEPGSWGDFLNQSPHDPAANFWLLRLPDGVFRVVGRHERDALLDQAPGAIVTLRLDALLVDLEHRTQDRSTAEERSHAWTKPDSSSIGPTNSPEEPDSDDPPRAPSGIAEKGKD